MNELNGKLFFEKIVLSIYDIIKPVFIYFSVLLITLGEAFAAQGENSYIDKTNQYSKGLEYRLISDVIAQLRNKSKEAGDRKLNALLQRVRVLVPNKSIMNSSPNAFAYKDRHANWIIVENNWLRQIAGLSELGTLYTLPLFGYGYPSFADETFNKFCRNFKVGYQSSIRNNNTPDAYMFRFEDYYSRADPDYALEYVMFDKLAGMVWINSVVWTVLHEVGHHALNHTIRSSVNNRSTRQQELDADRWAFSQMKSLGYSLLGIGGYMLAQSKSESCLSELGLIMDEAESTHPSWNRRNDSLQHNFNIQTAPVQDLRIYYTPVAIPEPILMTFVIPDSTSDNFQAIIVQRGNIKSGMTEWNGSTARVYLRDLSGSRIEFVIKNADKNVLIIEQQQYDKNNRFLGTVPLPTVQAASTSIGFLKVNGVKISNLSKRHEGNKFMRIHLNRLGASKTTVNQVINTADQYKKSMDGILMKYVKGKISYENLSEKTNSTSNWYEQNLIALLGQEHYRSFVDNYSRELKKMMPPMTGGNSWEERILKENAGR